MWNYGFWDTSRGAWQQLLAIGEGDARATIANWEEDKNFLLIHRSPDLTVFIVQFTTFTRICVFWRA